MFASHEVPTDEELAFLKKLSEAKSFEELSSIKLPSSYPHRGLADEYSQEVHRVASDLVKSAEAPEDLTAVQYYFQKHRYFSREIQHLLGEKAKAIFSNWRPTK